MIFRYQLDKENSNKNYVLNFSLHIYNILPWGPQHDAAFE